MWRFSFGEGQPAVCAGVPIAKNRPSTFATTRFPSIGANGVSAASLALPANVIFLQRLTGSTKRAFQIRRHEQVRHLGSGALVHRRSDIVVAAGAWR